MPATRPLLFLSDFGLDDGAVSAMKGVAVGVDPALRLFDVTHSIPPYAIWEGAYRLHQALPHWPEGTVVVAVVDPGVGSERRSVVVRLGGDRLYVGPDNGLATMLVDSLGAEHAWRIDETRERRHGTGGSHTFHGRDLYAYVGARLASGQSEPDDVGSVFPAAELVRLERRPARLDDGVLIGVVEALDVRYGHLWTNIPAARLDALGIGLGDRLAVEVIRDHHQVPFRLVAPHQRTFAEVPPGEPLVFVNSLFNLAIGYNLDDLAHRHGIEAGPDCEVRLRADR